MNRQVMLALVLVFSIPASAGTLHQNVPIRPLPDAVTNNAVAAVAVDGREYLVSFSGLGAGKEHADTHAHTWVYDNVSREWRRATDVPDGEGRLASVAVTAGATILVFGGYSVASDGAEISTPWVHAFDPASGTFERRADMPVPVDDAVAVTYDNRYVYLISGWHDLGNVNLVQRYDSATDTWSQATPTPGRGVFGHAGGIVGNYIVYCDGVAIEAHDDRRRDFVAVGDCYLGIIDVEDNRRIDWRSVPAHPGLPRYRMAAAGVADVNGVLFVGGSDNPYNYNGVGYDGEPSEPVPGAFLYSFDEREWLEYEVPGTSTMDHRGLVHFDEKWLTIGGMVSSQQVTRDIHAYSFNR